MKKRPSSRRRSVSFARLKKPSSSNLFWFILIAIALPIFVYALYTKTSLFSRAATERLFNNAAVFSNNTFNDTFAIATSSASLAKNPFTVEAWINVPEPDPKEQGVLNIASFTTKRKPSNFGHIWNFSLMRTSLGLTPKFELLYNNNYPNDPEYPYLTVAGDVTRKNNIVEKSSWQKIAVTSTDEGGGLCVLRLFLNGTLIKQASRQRKNCAIPVPENPTILIGKDPLNSPPFAYHFNGQLDEFRLSSVARYTQNYPVPTEPFASDENTLLMYRFNEQSGATVIKDNSINESHATIIGSHILFFPSSLPVEVPLLSFEQDSMWISGYQLRQRILNPGITATKVSMFFIGGEGSINVFKIWEDVEGKPGKVLAQTEKFQLTNQPNGNWYTAALPTAITLSQATFFIGIEKVDGPDGSLLNYRGGNDGNEQTYMVDGIGTILNYDSLFRIYGTKLQPTPTPTPLPPVPEPVVNNFTIQAVLQHPDGNQTVLPTINAVGIIRFEDEQGNALKTRVNWAQCMSGGALSLPIASGGTPCSAFAPGRYATQWKTTVKTGGATYTLISPTTCSNKTCSIREQSEMITGGRPIHRGVYQAPTPKPTKASASPKAPKSAKGKKK